MRPGRLALVAALLAAAACSGGRGTPEATYEQIRSAAATGDARLVYELHCSDARAVARQRVREMRARLERGDPPEDVLREFGLSEGDVREGTLDEAAARLMRRFSPVVAEARWYESAVVARVEPEGETAALLRLRGTDGAERTLWLVREQGRWSVDGPRTWGGR